MVRVRDWVVSVSDSCVSVSVWMACGVCWGNEVSFCSMKNKLCLPQDVAYFCSCFPSSLGFCLPESK